MQRRDLLLAGATLAARAAAQQPPRPQAKITTSVMLWTLKGSFAEKVEAVARAGAQSVEMGSEHVNWSDADLALNRKLCRSLGLGIDTIDATPNWSRRPVSMLDSAQRENFLADVRTAIGFARKLEVPQIILMAGNAIPGRSREEQYASLLEGTRRAGDLAAKADVTLIVEPLNSLVDHKKFFLTTCGEGLKLVREAANPHVKLLFDIYHEQVQAGNVIRTLAEAAPHVAVFHVADNPGRHEPGTGELNWPNIYKAIQKSDYNGYLTMEYLPTGEQTASLTGAIHTLRTSLL